MSSVFVVESVVVLIVLVVGVVVVVLLVAGTLQLTAMTRRFIPNRTIQ